MIRNVLTIGGLAVALILQQGPNSARGQQTAGPAATQQPATSPGVSTMVTPAVSPMLQTPTAEITPKQISAMQKMLSDWGQLSRYRDENAKLGDPAQGQKRVVFYGDSITDLWGRRAGKFFPDQPWVNRGIGGQTTPQMLVRFEQDVIALKPEAVVILAGINDIAGNTGPETLPEIESFYRAMVDLARINHVRVVISSVLPTKAFWWNKGVDPRDEVAALNRWLQQFASQEGLVYVDYYSAMVAPDRGIRADLSNDGVHPNNAGYAVMEPLARKAVEEALAAPKP
jgi:lysophospholipase L1-like esterase